MFNQAVQYLKDVRLELTKVAWPTKPELTGSTVVVIIMTIIMSAFIGVVDFGLSQVTKLILK